MAFKHGKASKLSVDDSGGVARDISPYVTGFSLSLDIDNPKTTTYGATGVTRSVVGLKDASFTIETQHDTTASVGSWTVLTALYGAANASSLAWGPEGTTAGLPRVTGEFRVKNLSFSDPVDGLVTITAQCEGDGGFTIDTY